MSVSLSINESCVKKLCDKVRLVAQIGKSLLAMKETWVWSLGWEDALEKEMATHSSILAGKSHGQRSLAGCSPWGHTELDTTEPFSFSFKNGKGWVTLSKIGFSLFSLITEFMHCESLRVDKTFWFIWPCISFFKIFLKQHTFGRCWITLIPLALGALQLMYMELSTLHRPDLNGQIILYPSLLKLI